MEPAAALLSQEEAWARRALTQASLAWWNASITGRPGDYKRMVAAERAINRHYSNPSAYRRLARLAQTPDLDALARRRLERLRTAYRAKQAPVDVLDRITSAESAIQERYSTFRAELDGQAATDNQLEDVLRSARDTTRVRQAWEARKQIGAVVADDLRRLAHLRNESARAIGFADFWHAQLELDELDPESLLQTLDAVDVSTLQAFQAMKIDLDAHLATRFGVQAHDLRPWHYADPFFQETPEVFAPPADPLYAHHDVVAFAAETYRALGFGNIDAILSRSDLYPRPGKNQHAYAVDIDREGDVRTFLNVEPNARWMGTLLHELGHTIYQDGIDRTELPWDLRDDPQGFLNEGFAMFCEQPTTNPDWLSDVVGLSPSEARTLGPRLATQQTASLLAFVRWCLSIVHFERAFYADPDQDLNRLWWDLEERYQQVPRPDGRDAPDWAAKVHVATAPVYYQKYLLGKVFAAQLNEEIERRFGGWWAGRPDSGGYVAQHLFAPGATYHWNDLIERVTGKRLTVTSLAKAIRWPGAGR